MNTHKQQRTNREKGLENIVESMYSPKSEGYTPPDDPNYKGDKTREPALVKGPKCTHPGCKDGKHADGSKCPKCKGSGHLPLESAGDYVPPHDEDKLDRAKQRGYDDHDAALAKGRGHDYKVGDIIKAGQIDEDRDWVIVGIYEEDGAMTYALMEVGEEGISVKARDVKPDDTPSTNF